MKPTLYLLLLLTICSTAILGGCYPYTTAKSLPHNALSDTISFTAPTKVILYDESVILFNRGCTISHQILSGKGMRYSCFCDTVSSEIVNWHLSTDSVYMVITYPSRENEGMYIGAAIMYAGSTWYLLAHAIARTAFNFSSSFGFHFYFGHL